MTTTPVATTPVAPVPTAPATPAPIVNAPVDPTTGLSKPFEQTKATQITPEQQHAISQPLSTQDQATIDRMTAEGRF